MDPVDKLIATRKAVGASVDEFARLVGFSGPNAADNFRQLERGKRPLVGPLIPLLDALEPGLDIGTLRTAVLQTVPAYVELTPLKDGVDFEGVMRTRYPRFVAVFTGLLPDALVARLANSGYASVPTPGDTELGDMVAIPLDPFDGDLVPYLAEAAKLKF